MGGRLLSRQQSAADRLGEERMSELGLRAGAGRGQEPLVAELVQRLRPFPGRDLDRLGEDRLGQRPICNAEDPGDHPRRLADSS